METKFFMSEEHRTIDYLEVQSFEMSVYLVKLGIGDDTGMLCDDTGSPKKFTCVAQIRDSFAHCNVTTSVMKHDSPYDEMIGNPAKASYSEPLPFSMTAPF